MPIPAFLTGLAGIFSGKGTDIVKNIMPGLDELFTSKEEKLIYENKRMEIEMLITKAANEHVEKMGEQSIRKAELAVQERTAELQDVANARAMQIEALKQDDKFAKRYILYLGSFMILASFTYGIMLFYVRIPKENQRMCEMFADIFLFAGAVMVLQFFFGSSKSSQDKTQQMLTTGK